MNIQELLGGGVLVLIFVSLVFFTIWLRKPGIRMIQWGRYISERAGSKGHPMLEDEPDIVQYENYQYWIRCKPNPGISIPVFGYWSKAYGRTRPRQK